MADEVNVTSNGTVAMKPTYIRVANTDSKFLNKDESILPFGIAPTFYFTDVQLESMIVDSITTKSKRKEIITFVKRKSSLHYLHTVCKVILEHQKYGVKLTIGRNNPNSYHFIPLVFNFISDNAESNYMACVRSAPQCNMKCRQCCTTRDLMNTGD